MKTFIILIALGLMVPFSGFSGEIPREKVYSIIKQIRSTDWYLTQSELWDEYLKSNPKDGEAWVNYYTANRMLKITGGPRTQSDLDKIVDRLEAAIPGTFEFHHVKYWNADFRTKEIYHLKTAYAMAPDRPETYDALLTHYEIHGDQDGKKMMAQRIFDANAISANIYAWNYNMLVSTDPNSILFTVGDNDTYPSMVLQQAKEVRRDVQVMNLSLLTIDDYRKRLFSELRLPEFTKTMQQSGSFEKFVQDICSHVFNNTERSVYFTPTMSRHLYEAFKPNLYNVGQAFKWTNEKFDNIAVTKRNFEKVYLTDHLKISLFDDRSVSVANQLNGSYLMSMLTLHNHYKESEDGDAEDLELLISKIAQKSYRAEEINKLMNKQTDGVVSMVIDDPRKAYLGMLKVNDSLHVSQCEVATQQYDLFLLDLLKMKRFDDLNTARSEEVNWKALLPENLNKLSMEEVFEHGTPGDDNFPVCNISYEAAVLYCEWLTAIYNGLDHKKKKYKEVEFRLPTEAEWEFLASGGKGKKSIKFPWGQHLRNARGCFLANINADAHDSMPKGDNPEEGCATGGNENGPLDGGIFPVEKMAYSPNDFGLYQMAGNLAEMVQEKGVAKGGSWNSKAEEATIGSRKNYSAPGPEVGFRVIMIVKEF